MKLKKCSNNHYYNENTNEFCPHCPVPPILIEAQLPIIESTSELRSAQEYVPETPVFRPAAPAAVPIASEGSELPTTDDQKTVAVWDAPSGTEPVVGWIICVKGSYFGQSFVLKTGNNSVGRSMDMDIPLAQENTISRNRHCTITFEPEKQEFFIQPGESTGLIYLNGEVVMTVTRLIERDAVRIGNCEFVFYPLCGDKFNWKNVI